MEEIGTTNAVAVAREVDDGDRGLDQATTRLSQIIDEVEHAIEALYTRLDSLLVPDVPRLAEAKSTEDSPPRSIQHTAVRVSIGRLEHCWVLLNELRQRVDL